MSKKPIERNKMISVKSMANKINLALFNEFGASIGELPVLCSCCGCVTTIDDSHSDKGKNLICNKCSYAHFETWNDVYNNYIFK